LQAFVVGAKAACAGLRVEMVERSAQQAIRLTRKRERRRREWDSAATPVPTRRIDAPDWTRWRRRLADRIMQLATTDDFMRSRGVPRPARAAWRRPRLAFI